jgi:hypothetical protein
MKKTQVLLVIIFLVQNMYSQNWQNEYDYVINKPKEGFFIARKSIDWFWVDKKGKKLTQTTFTSISEFTEGIAIAKKDFQFFLVNLKGEIIKTDKIYSTIKEFKNGIAEVWWKDSIGLINKKGKLISPSRYRITYPPQEGFSIVAVGDVNNTKYGFINEKGVEVIPTTYAAVFNFSDNKAYVTKEYMQETHIINKKGERLFIDAPKDIFNEYAFTREFYKGTTIISNKDGYALFNGKILVQGLYEKIMPLDNGIYRVNKNGKYGCINHLGKEIVPLDYTFIS